jgi:hypothetical protein
LKDRCKGEFRAAQRGGARRNVSGSGRDPTFGRLFVWFVGMVAIALSGWEAMTKVVVGTAYTMLAPFLLQFAALLAVCTTGDCV